MRLKTIAVLVVVAAAAAVVVIPTIRKHRAESSANERRGFDVEIARYYDQTAKPLLRGEAKDPARVIGKVLPVMVRNGIRPEDGSALDTGVYAELDPAVRTDRLDGAGTIAFIESEGTAVYSGGATGMATVANGLTVTLFDPATKTVLGRTHVDAPELPGETNQDGLDYVGARQAARVAAYLKGLPRAAQ